MTFHSFVSGMGLYLLSFTFSIPSLCALHQLSFFVLKTAREEKEKQPDEPMS